MSGEGFRELLVGCPVGQPVDQARAVCHPQSLTFRPSSHYLFDVSPPASAPHPSSPGPAMFDATAIRALLGMSDLIRVMESAHAALARGEVVQPVRSVIPVAQHSGFFGVMSAWGGALGAKLVTFYPQNRDVATHHAVVVLFRPETGEPLAVMDGTVITEMRTAATSAAATRALARPDASILAILGAGVQARSHLEALRKVRDFHEVRVWSPRSARAFAEDMGVDAADSAEAAVRGAHVVVVATTSLTPVLQGDWLAPGTHVNAVGACRPNWRELDDASLRRARLFVDSRDAAVVESGDVIAAAKRPTEIGELFAGTAPGRATPDEITLFKSVGIAIQDVAAADLVWRRSRNGAVDQ